MIGGKKDFILVIYRGHIDIHSRITTRLTGSRRWTLLQFDPDRDSGATTMLERESGVGNH